jgi:hypothetical protein
MHWAAHGIGGLLGIVAGIVLLATCFHSVPASCAETASCLCLNAFEQTVWPAEKAAATGGFVGVVLTFGYRAVTSD